MYVRNDDERFWAWAQEQAEAKGVALSVWVTNLIRNHKYDVGAKQATEETPTEMLVAAKAKIELAMSALRKEDES